MATESEVGLKHRRKAAVLGVAGAAFAAAALAAVSTAHGAVGPVIGTSPLAPPLGACLGSQCPGTWPPPHNGDFAGRDAAINIYAGADFTVTGRAAEAEGKIVVLGDFTVDKNGGGIFNTGVVGVGSRVPPPDGTDFVTVGGNVNVRPTNRLEVGGVDSKGAAYGNLVYGGTATGTISVVPSGQAMQRPGAADQYLGLRDYIEDRSTCAATAPATGTVSVSPSAVTFTGDGASPLQVFDVPGDIGGGRTVGIEFNNIPAGATVLVNMTGTAPTINTYTGTGLPGDQTTELRPRLMWNFPNATSATIRGGAQFQGSILGGNPGGTLSVQTPGQNGRVYVAGGLELTNSSAGSEFHAYPFDGLLPECGTSPVTTSSTTTTATETPTASTTSTSSSSSSSSSSPSEPSTAPTHPTSTLPTTPSGTQASFATSASHRGGLAATGSSLAPLLGLTAAALSVGAGVLGYTGRKKGKHA